MISNRLFKKAISLILAVALSMSSIPVFAEETKYEGEAGWETLYPMGIFNFEHTEYAVVESDNSVDIEVLRMGGTKGEVGVEINVVGVNAVYGEDFFMEGAEESMELPGSYGMKLVFAEGQVSQNIKIHFLQDEISENKEVFMLNLINAENDAVVGENCSIPFAIDDDEAEQLPVIQLSREEYSADASAGAVEVTILRKKGEQRLVSFDMSTRSGTASVGEDYQGITTSVMLNPGETEKKVAIPVLNPDSEGKSFYFELSNVQGGILGEPASASILITDEGIAKAEAESGAGDTVEYIGNKAAALEELGQDIGEAAASEPEEEYEEELEAGFSAADTASDVLTADMFRKRKEVLFKLPKQKETSPDYTANILPMAAQTDSFSKKVVIHDSSSPDKRLGFKSLKAPSSCEQMLGTAADGRIGFYYNAKNSEGEAVISSTRPVDLTGIERINYSWRNAWSGDHQEYVTSQAYFTMVSDLNAPKLNFGSVTGPFNQNASVSLSLITNGARKATGDMFINFSIKKSWTHLFFSDPIIDLYVTKIELIKREYGMVVNQSPNGTVRLVKLEGVFSIGHDKAVRDDVFYIDARPNPGWRFKGYKLDKKSSTKITELYKDGEYINIDSGLLREVLPVDHPDYDKIHVTPVFEKLPETRKITIKCDYPDMENTVWIYSGRGYQLPLEINKRTEYRPADPSKISISISPGYEYRFLYWILPDGRIVNQDYFLFDMTNVYEAEFKVVVAPVSKHQNSIDDEEFGFLGGQYSGSKNVDVLGLVPRSGLAEGKTVKWEAAGVDEFYSSVYYFIAGSQLPVDLKATITDEAEPMTQSIGIRAATAGDSPSFTDPLKGTLYYNGKTVSCDFGKQISIQLPKGRRTRVALKMPGYQTQVLDIMPQSGTIYFNARRIASTPPEISWISLNNTFVAGREYTPVPRYDANLSLTAKINWNGRKPYRVHFITKSEADIVRHQYTVNVPPEISGSMNDIWNDVTYEFDLMNDLLEGDKIFIRPETKDGSPASDWDTGIRLISPQQFSTVDTAATFNPDMAFGFRAPFTIPLLGEPNFAVNMLGVEVNSKLDRGAGIYTITAGYASEIEKCKQSMDANNTKLTFKDWYKNPLNSAGKKIDDYIANLGDDGKRALTDGVKPGLNLNLHISYGMKMVFKFNHATNEWQPREGWVYIGGKLKVTRVYYFLISFVPAFVSLGANVDVKVFTGAEYDPKLPPGDKHSWEGVEVESKILGNITGGAGIYNLAALTASGKVDAKFNGAIPVKTPAEFTKAEIDLSFGIGVQYLGFSYTYNLTKKKWDLLDPAKNSSIKAYSVTDYVYGEYVGSLGASSVAEYVYGKYAGSEAVGFVPAYRGPVREADWESFSDEEQLDENMAESKVYSFSDADPQLVGFGEGKKLLVFMEDDTSRGDMDKARLMFSVLEDDLWSDPVAILDDGTSDYMPSVAVYGDKALVLWLNNTQIYEDENPDFEAYLNNYKVNAAIIDLADKAVEEGSISSLTSHSFHDSTPVVAFDDAGNAMVLWTTTYFEEEITDMNSLISSPSILMYSTFDSDKGKWNAAKPMSALTGEILSKDLHYSNGHFAFAYTVSADDSLITETDEELFIQIFDVGSEKWTEPERISYNNEKDFNPSIIKTEYSELLFWQSGKKLCYFDMRLLTEYLLNPEEFAWEDPEAGFAEETRVAVQLEEGNYPTDLIASANEAGEIVLLWKDIGAEVAQALFAAYGSVRDPREVLWSKPRQINENNMVIRDLALDCDNAGSFYTAFTKNDVVYNEDTEEYSMDDTALVFASVDLTKDIKVEDDTVSISNRCPRPGEMVDISLYVTNDGELPIEPGELEVKVYSVIDGQRQIELTDENKEAIAAGYEQGANINFEMPRSEDGLEGIGFQFIIDEKTIDKYIAFEKAPEVGIFNLRRSVLTDGSCIIQADIINTGNADAEDVEIGLFHLEPANLAEEGYRLYKTPEGVETAAIDRIVPSGMAGSEGEAGAAKQIEFIYKPEEAYYDESGIIDLRLEVNLGGEFHTEQVFYISRYEFGNLPEDDNDPDESEDEGKDKDKDKSTGSSSYSSWKVQTRTSGGRIEKDIIMNDRYIQAAGFGETLKVEALDSADSIGILSDLSVLGDLSSRKVTLELKTDYATYSLPLDSIDIEALMRQAGYGIDPKDIKVRIEISRQSAERMEIIKQSVANHGLKLIGIPLDFSIICSVGDRNFEYERFNGFVERIFTGIENTDANKISTGVIIDDEGNLRHVPTKIALRDGQAYISVSSMTNSTYALVSNPFSFGDIKGHWAEADMNDMGIRMIVSGTGDGMFEPGRDITRAEFAAILVRALGLRAGTGSNKFTDVNSKDWYCDYIKTADEYGLISGYGNSEFGPNDRITREQAMTMTARAMKLTGLNSGITEGDISILQAGFADFAQAAVYAEESIAACVKNGIISGKGSSMLAPKDNITRAEVATIVRRLLKKSGLI